nr:hypothetical protein [Tanacetum cinerariifolium]
LFGKFNGKVDEGFLVGYSNTDEDAAFGGKKPEFKEEKPESKVHVSLSSSAQTKKHDDKSKREAKGKSPVELSTGYRNLGYKYHPLHVISYPLDQIRADLSYVKEPEAILDRQERVMRKKTIPFIKILWRNHPERDGKPRSLSGLLILISLHDL